MSKIELDEFFRCRKCNRLTKVSIVFDSRSNNSYYLSFIQSNPGLVKIDGKKLPCENCYKEKS